MTNLAHLVAKSANIVAVLLLITFIIYLFWIPSQTDDHNP